ncbi:MAG: carboxypeptidase-like regulatory domain-containing protein [Acidobacteriota bacterium]|nr:carboxypeptidase-like regulatory domain-containing protein [Acidobacteriota bacterium]
MSRTIIVIAVVVFIAAACCGRLTYGQVTGSFLGTVTDKSGSAISGATVTVTSQGTGATRDTKTDDAGHYIVNLLPVSIYSIRVEFKGFQTTEAKDVKLQVDEQRELDFTLALSTVSSSVEVVANAVAVETTSPSLGQVITSQEVAQLPLNGRDFVQLATLTPGTTQETNPNSFFTSGASSEVAARGSFSLSVGGSRANSTDWLLDGTDNNELTAGGIGILSSIDSIQEFKVLTYNYSAEYGTRAGPTVLVTSKSGTNDFHGSLFEFLRNTDLDAKSFFATSREKFNLNQFGGGIGGPIRKNKTFFFVDGEQKYQRHGITFAGLVPTKDMRNGDFTDNALGVTNPVGVIVNPNMTIPGPTPTSPPITTPFYCDASGNPIVPNADGSQTQVTGGSACNKIPPAMFNNSIGAKMIALYPLPTPGYDLNGNNFLSEPVRSLNETKFDARLDHNFSSADSVFARFSYDQATSYVPGGATGYFAEAGAFASNQGIINHARNVSIGETHVFTSTTVNQFSFGYNRIFDYITSQGTGTCESNIIGIPGANLNCGPITGTTCAGSSCGLTSVGVTGYWSLGDRGYSPFQGGTNIFTINDSFDMIRGKHDIKVGGGIRINEMNVRAEGFQDGYWVVSGAWTGDPAADMLLGLASLRIHDQNFNGDITGRRWKLFRPFVQDDWRATKDLTLNLGLAWAMAKPISEADGRMANFIPSATSYQWLIPGSGCTTAFQPCTSTGPSAGVKMDWTALEPRVGLAWKVLGSDKTVVRGGFAIYHDSGWSMGAQGLWQNPPFAAESFGIQFGGCTTVTAWCASHGGTPNVGPPAVDGFSQMVGFSDGFPSIPSPVTPPNFAGSFNTENTNLKQGQVQQFNINLERQLPGQIVLTAGYAGSRGSHILSFGNNINTSSPYACAGGPDPVAGYTLGCGPGGAYIPLAFPNFPFSDVYSINDFGSAHYNSLQIKAETKSTRYGIYALIGYSYSRTYDSGYSDGLSTPIGAPDFPLPGWQKLDWALSQINLDNSFTASVIYDLPFGKGKKFGNNWNNATNALLGNWQVTLIEKITSGFPVFIIDSNSASTGGANLINIGTAAVAGRTDEVGNPFQAGTIGSCVGPSTLGAKGYWFNPCAFAAPPPNELGTTSRAPLSGPDFVNTDFSIIKRFALPRENMGLDFRVEMFNLFNHAQFGLPAADLNAPSFGLVSSTVNNPRLVQLGLKLTF